MSGPQLEKMAREGNPEAYAHKLPLPLSKSHKQSAGSCDFSYAGLKTSVASLAKAEKQRVQRECAEAEREAALRRAFCDIAASFQAVAVKHLAQRMERAVRWVQQMEPNVQHVVVAGVWTCGQLACCPPPPTPALAARQTPRRMGGWMAQTGGGRPQ